MTTNTFARHFRKTSPILPQKGGRGGSGRKETRSTNNQPITPNATFSCLGEYRILMLREKALALTEKKATIIAKYTVAKPDKDTFMEEYAALLKQIQEQTYSLNLAQNGCNSSTCSTFSFYDLGRSKCIC